MKNNSKKKWLATAAALAAIAAMAGTFAWFQSTDNVKNEFVGQIAGNDIEIVEDFTPPTEWPIGEKVQKDVAVLNTGKYDSFIRVSLKETITKLADDKAYYGDKDKPLTEDAFLFELGSRDLTGFTDSVMAETTKINISNNNVAKYNSAYTLKAKEKVTNNTDGSKKYEYVSYWQNDTDATVKLYAKTGGFKRNATGALTPNRTAQFQYVKLGYGGSVVADWTGKNNVAPIPTTPHVPIPGIDDGKATIELQGAADKKILITFANVTKTPEKGKWNYNQKDGFFYFVGIVPAQQQTAKLIESVKIDGSADNSYSKVKYDLDVNAVGIQALKEVVNSDSWLGTANAADPLNQALSSLSGLKDGKGNVNP